MVRRSWSPVPPACSARPAGGPPCRAPATRYVGVDLRRARPDAVRHVVGDIRDAGRDGERHARRRRGHPLRGGAAELSRRRDPLDHRGRHRPPCSPPRAAAGVDRIVHISSTAVYGLPKMVPTPEEHPREPGRHLQPRQGRRRASRRAVPRRRALVVTDRCALRRSSGRAGWACSRCCSSGPRRAATSRCSAAATCASRCSPSTISWTRS